MSGKWKNYHILSENLLRQGNSDKATELLNKALNFAPDEESRVETYFTLGDLYWQQEEYLLAEEAFQKIRALGDYPGADYALGVLMEEGERDREAMVYLEDAVAKDPAYESACYELALLYDRFGYKEDALKLFMRCAELVPENGVVFSDIASIYEERMDYEKALPLAEKAVRLSPTYSIGYYNLGVIYQKTGRDKEALRAYRESLVYDEYYAPTYLNMSAVYLRNERVEEAIAILTKGITLDLKSVNLFYNRACSYVRLGKRDEAIADLKEAIAINDDAKMWASRDEDLQEIVREVDS